jgi:pilus assembly protein FimV
VDTLKEKLGGEVSAAEEDLLDFDFDLDSSELAGGTETEAVEELDFESELESAMASEADQGLDFDMDFESPGKPAATKTEAKPSAGRAENALDFDVSSLDFNLDQVEQEAKSTEKHGAIDFDMGSLETAAEPAAEETAPEIDLGDLTFDEGEAAVSEESTVGAGLEEASLGETLGEDLGADIFGEVDEVGTKLDLAKAYVDMGDSEGARSILGEVLEEGNDSQKQQARELMAQIH